MTASRVTPLRLAAPAKLNLSLRVVGRREDGIHELDGVMLLLELADRLLLLPGCSGLRVTDGDGEPVPGLPVRGAENLAWLGLGAGLDGAPDEALVCLTLEKRVPVAAGLGGGSSDAAAGWRLGRRWAGGEEATSPDALAALSRIGADVPFFAAAAAAARVRGIGERIMPLPAPAPRSILLVHSPRPLATPAVFAALRPRDWSAEVATDVETALTDGRNDLLRAARRVAPQIDDVSALVVAAGARPRLTGSGPTIFTVDDDPEHAEVVARRLERGGMRVTRTRSRRAAASIEPIDEEDT